MSKEGISTPMLYKQAAGCNCIVWNCDHEENFWTDIAVRKIIRDEHYLGKVVFGKRYYDIIEKHHSIRVHKKDWIVVENTHEAIVTQEEFDRAQAVLKQFMERNGRAETEVLCGKVRCGICGHTLARVKRKKSYYINQDSLSPLPESERPVHFTLLPNSAPDYLFDNRAHWYLICFHFQHNQLK